MTYSGVAIYRLKRVESILCAMNPTKSGKAELSFSPTRVKLTFVLTRTIGHEEEHNCQACVQPSSRRRLHGGRYILNMNCCVFGKSRQMERGHTCMVNTVTTKLACGHGYLDTFSYLFYLNIYFNKRKLMKVFLP